MSLRKNFFALTYDRFSRAAEEAELREMRQSLLAEAHGRVLEIGGGTGANLPHYNGIDSLVITEPEPPMLRRLERKAREHEPLAKVLRAPAEDLPFEDDTFSAEWTTSRVRSGKHAACSGRTDDFCSSSTFAPTIRSSHASKTG
jgi:ubiquinone/menaquinone biosynthesis C-methylase UbiE